MRKSDHTCICCYLILLCVCRQKKNHVLPNIHFKKSPWGEIQPCPLTWEPFFFADGASISCTLVDVLLYRFWGNIGEQFHFNRQQSSPFTPTHAFYRNVHTWSQKALHLNQFRTCLVSELILGFSFLNPWFVYCCYCCCLFVFG